MDKIRICIIDDEEYFLKAADSLLTSLSKELNICIDAHFFQGIKNSAAMNYDMYFIDIQMPDANGFELSHNIYSESTGKIVFVSSVEEYVFSSYQNHAYDFVRKSRLYDDMKRVIQRYLEETKDYITIETQKQRFKIHLQDIEYIKTLHNDILICTPVEDIKIRMTMKDFLSSTGLLEKRNFAQINRGEIVNLDEIKEIEKKTIILKSGNHLSVSRNMFTKFRNMYYTYKYR